MFAFILVAYDLANDEERAWTTITPPVTTTQYDRHMRKQNTHVVRQFESSVGALHLGSLYREHQVKTFGGQSLLAPSSTPIQKKISNLNDSE